MKKLLLLIITVALCNLSVYADIKTIKYKIPKYRSDLLDLALNAVFRSGDTYMIVKGNFDKRILVDGDILIDILPQRGDMFKHIQIIGKYEKGEIIGTMEIREFNHTGFIIEVQGSISNNVNGSISTKCKYYDWKCDLRTKVIPTFSDRNCAVSATASLILETSPITIKMSERSGVWFGHYLGLAIREIEPYINRKRYCTTITFSDNLTYEGSVEYNRTLSIPQVNRNDPMHDVKLTWSNGDTFEGAVYNWRNSEDFYSNQIRPSKGIIKYHDGQEFEYSNKDFADFKIGNNGLCVSPSEMKESFENTIREREEKRLREIREEEERKEKRLREIREEEERKAAAEREKRDKEIARKNELIRKYGQKYGEAIFNKKPQTGMTIEMVKAMHGSTQGRMNRRISQGNEITVLSYGGDYVSLFGISGVTPRFEYTFRNGRLIEFSATDGQASIDW